MKRFKLRTPRANWSLVPFVNASYLTEFTPPVNEETKLTNAKRRELNGIAGLVLTPDGWVREVRLGAIAKNDLAQTIGGFEPGVQLAAELKHAFGPATIELMADVKQYFLTLEDTPDDHGLQGRFAPTSRIPLWGALG